MPFNCGLSNEKILASVIVNKTWASVSLENFAIASKGVGYQLKISLPQLKTNYEAFLPVGVT